MDAILKDIRNWLWVQGQMSAMYGPPVAISEPSPELGARYARARRFERRVRRMFRGR